MKARYWKYCEMNLSNSQWPNVCDDSSLTPLEDSEIVFVEWMDSTTTFGWREPDADGPSVIVSVGILVHHDESSIVISTSRSSGGRYVDQLSIPLGCVRKISGASMPKPGSDTTLKIVPAVAGLPAGERGGRSCESALPPTQKGN